MEYEPAEYQKLQIRQYAPRSLRETAEGKYWRQFKAPTIAKQVLDGAIAFGPETQTGEALPPRQPPHLSPFLVALLGRPRCDARERVFYCGAVWRGQPYRLLSDVPLQCGRHSVDTGGWLVTLGDACWGASAVRVLTDDRPHCTSRACPATDTAVCFGAQVWGATISLLLPLQLLPSLHGRERLRGTLTSRSDRN